MLDSERTCYTCLNENCINLTNAFNEDSDSITYWDKLKFITNTELQQGELSGLCEPCLSCLRVAYMFVKTVRASQEKLHGLEEDDGYTFEPLVEITELDKSGVDLKQTNFVETNAKKHCANVEEVKISKDVVYIKSFRKKRVNVKENVASRKNGGGLQLYECGSCNKAFNYKVQMREHILTHSRVSLFKCGYCSRSFCTAGYRKRHHDLHRAKGHRGKGNEEINDNDAGEQAECNFCEELSTTLTDARYKFIDKIKLKCEYCGQEFKSNFLVMKHIGKDHGERVYSCEFCDRNFKRLYLLQLHMHKNHECNLFYRKAEETRLGKIEEKPSTEHGYKPFICPVCGKGFPLRNTKKRHMRVHLDIKKYVCRVCMQRFSQSYQLKLHSRRHTGEKPYECNRCPMTFLSNTNLQRHLSQHADFEVTQEIESINVDCDVFIENDKDDHFYLESENCSDVD